MKKILLLAILLISVVTFGQKRHAGAAASTQSDSTTVSTSKYVPYVSVGLSISNGNSYETNANSYGFNESSYPSVEVGVSRENLSAGIAFGRRSLKGLGNSEDNIKNYYTELRVVPSFKLGVVNASLIFGIGSYLGRIENPDGSNTDTTFIEYGTGISYSVGNYSYGLAYSNWDGLDYITPSLSYSFN
jgi:hypothetical protein